KKPRPLTITSSERPVCCGLPCWKSLEVDTTRTPVPSCRPEGNWVWAEVEPPGWRSCWYSRSSKLARSRLNPVVLVLARLFETTDMRVCCASSPVLATHSAWFMTRYLVRRIDAGADACGVPNRAPDRQRGRPRVAMA